MYIQQNGLCATCGLPPLPGKPLNLDHNHITKRNRQLLCRPCNDALGLLREDYNTILRMIDYICTVIPEELLWTYRGGQHDTTRFAREMMTRNQGGTCAICEQFPSARTNLGVDHNHTTNTIRGLLCGKCNSALGLVRESPEILTNMLFYLADHQDNYSGTPQTKVELAA